MLPGDAVAFQADRTVREVVTLNLFAALQDVLSLATHWLADGGDAVPQGYRDVFLLLRRAPGRVRRVQEPPPELRAWRILGARGRS